MTGSGISKNRGRPSSVVPATSLAELRAKRGWALRDLEGHTGIGVATWSQLERGLLTPQPKHLAALSGAFGLPLSSWRVRFLLETEAA